MRIPKREEGEGSQREDSRGEEERGGVGRREKV